jgi:hypothetical protein
VIHPPFDEEHTWFYQFFHAICENSNSTGQGEDRIVIAGSAALDQYTRRHMGFTIDPHDVDFFTTLELDEDEMNWLMYKMMRLQQAFHITAQKIQYFATSTYPSRIHAIYNFKLCYLDTDGKLLEPISFPVQLICLEMPRDQLFPTSTESFTRIVINRFDLSICKCAILSDTLLDIFVEDEIEIQNMRMTYDLRNFRNILTMHDRIWKYLNRGFLLNRIQITSHSFITTGTGFLATYDLDEHRITTSGIHNIVESDEEYTE